MPRSEALLNSPGDAKRDAVSLVLLWKLKSSFLDLARSNLIEAACRDKTSRWGSHSRYLLRRKRRRQSDERLDALKEPSPFDTTLTPRNDPLDASHGSLARLHQA